jgi:hypothetical protein
VATVEVLAIAEVVPALVRRPTRSWRRTGLLGVLFLLSGVFVYYTFVFATANSHKQLSTASDMSLPSIVVIDTTTELNTPITVIEDSVAVEMIIIEPEPVLTPAALVPVLDLEGSPAVETIAPVAQTLEDFAPRANAVSLRPRWSFRRALLAALILPFRVVKFAIVFTFGLA